MVIFYSELAGTQVRWSKHKKCTYLLRTDLVLQILLMCRQYEFIGFSLKAAMIYWHIIGLDFGRIQLPVDNNYMPQKKYCFFVTVIVNFCIKLISGKFKFNFIIQISYSMKHLFIYPFCDYIDSEQSLGQIICIKKCTYPPMWSIDVVSQMR